MFVFVVYMVSFNSVSRENGKADSVTTVVLFCIDMSLQDALYIVWEAFVLHQLVAARRAS